MASDKPKFSKAVRERARAFMEYIENGEFAHEDSRDMEALIRYPDLLDSGDDESDSGRPYILRNEHTYFADFDQLDDDSSADAGDQPPFLESIRNLNFSGTAATDAAELAHRSTTPVEDPQGPAWLPVVNGAESYQAPERVAPYAVLKRCSSPPPNLDSDNVMAGMYNGLHEDDSWGMVNTNLYQQTQRRVNLSLFDPNPGVIPSEGNFSCESQSPGFRSPASYSVHTAPAPPFFAGYPSYTQYALRPTTNNDYNYATSGHAAEASATTTSSCHDGHTRFPEFHSTSDNELYMREVGIQYRRILEEQRLRDARLESEIRLSSRDGSIANDCVTKTLRLPLLHPVIPTEWHGADNGAEKNAARDSSDDEIVGGLYRRTSIEEGQSMQQALEMPSEMQQSKRTACEDYSASEMASSQRAKLGAHPDGLNDEEDGAYRGRPWNMTRSSWQGGAAEQVEYREERVENHDESEETRDVEDGKQNMEDRPKLSSSLGNRNWTRCRPELNILAFTGENNSLPFCPRPRPHYSSPEILHSFPLSVAASTPLPEDSFSSVHSSPYPKEISSTVGLGPREGYRNSQDMGRDISSLDASTNCGSQLDAVPVRTEAMYDVELEDPASVGDIAPGEWVNVMPEPETKASDSQGEGPSPTRSHLYIRPVYASLRDAIEHARFFRRLIEMAAGPDGLHTAQPEAMQQQNGIDGKMQAEDKKEESKADAETTEAESAQTVEKSRIDDNDWAFLKPVDGGWEVDDHNTEEADL